MSQAQAKPLKKLLLLTLIAVAILLAGYCLKLAYADALTYPVRYFVNKQEQQAKLADQQQLAKHISQTEQALALSPYQQDLPSYLARLHYYQAQHFEYLSTEYLSELNSAKQYHLQNLELRSAWSASWAEVAKLEALTAGATEEFYQAIENSQVYGPWESSSNLNSLIALLSHWDNLDKAQHQKAIQFAVRAGHFTAKSTGETVKFYNKQFQFCSKIGITQKLFKELCLK